MADEDKAVSSPAKSKKTGAIIVAALLLIEGGGIFAAMKFFGSDPSPTQAVEGAGQSSAEQRPDVAEVTIAETEAFNNLSGRLYVYHIEVSALVASEKVETITKMVEERQATIRDRVNTVIRGTDPKHLNEPGLETVRRQVQFELNKILVDDSLILEVLIPKLMQSRTRL
ncbi:MAG: hypothetical protein GY778_14300 [bacterium]|nr:hypothetical protein [bacterium]